jgi:3-isopropylmalate/(R)-2-methylmalate dehydratase large subunit
MFEKIWDAHVVHAEPGWPSLLYVDQLLLHEVNSPQAFEGLRTRGRGPRRPERILAAMDHVVPTCDRSVPTPDELAQRQMDTLAHNCADFGITLYDLHSPRQGILHVIGPELGLVRPGMVVVCSDSHACTNGALGAFALGCGASGIEHVLATQCVRLHRPKTMEIRVTGGLQPGVTAKDIALHLVGAVGIDGCTGHAVEYTGEAVRALSMEGRLTLCNLSIEMGAQSGMVAPDDVTFSYLEERPGMVRGMEWERALGEWQRLPTETGAAYDRVVEASVDGLSPQVTWGTNPGMVMPVDGLIPEPSSLPTGPARRAVENALAYMGLEPGGSIQDVPVDCVFIGSCTNARLEDLRLAARAVRGRRVHARVRALVVPGSRQVKRQAEEEGLDREFLDAGFEWREPGCSMCQGMNPDTVAPGTRLVATSNRNFENRQGKGVRTHLVSPATAAAAAVAGRFVDARHWLPEE